MAESHRTEGDTLLLHLVLPQLQQEAAILLVERTSIGQEACGQQHVSDQVFDLGLEASAAVCPTDLEHKPRVNG